MRITITLMISGTDESQALGVVQRVLDNGTLQAEVDETAGDLGHSFEITDVTASACREPAKTAQDEQDEQDERADEQDERALEQQAIVFIPSVDIERVWHAVTDGTWQLCLDRRSATKVHAFAKVADLTDPGLDGYRVVLSKHFESMAAAIAVARAALQQANVVLP